MPSARRSIPTSLEPLVYTGEGRPWPRRAHVHVLDERLRRLTVRGHIRVIRLRVAQIADRLADHLEVAAAQRIDRLCAAAGPSRDVVMLHGLAVAAGRHKAATLA